MSFRVNNTRVGYIDFPGSIFLGVNSGILTTGIRNIGIGSNALRNNTTGISNLAIGWHALYTNQVGQYNTAIGTDALRNNTTGNSNLAMGRWALNKNVEGSYNTATGDRALYGNTNGQWNTAYGSQALFSNELGKGNAGFGYQTLYNNTGMRNSAFGYLSMFNTTAGQNNAAIGNSALHTNTSGSNNTALGALADVSDGNLTNATAIGYDAKVDASNKVRIGNTDVGVIEGQVAFTNPSDARFKYEVQNNVPGLEFITKLKPATYYFDHKKLEKFSKTGVIDESWADTDGLVLKTGFLAQEVEQAAQEVGYDFDGINKPQNDRDKYTLAYSTFVVPLVKAVQEQQQIIDSLNEKINAMEAKLEAITQQIEASSAAPAPSVLVSN